MRYRSRKSSGRPAISVSRLLVPFFLGLMPAPTRAQISPSLPPPPPLETRPGPGNTTAGNWNGWIPLKVTNECDSMIWPGIASQSGTGPGTGGFALESEASRLLWVSPDWQGRVWGRTNCTVNGDSASCTTGDCFSKLDCQFSGATPATLAEFNLAGGANGLQTFYDISLVDGYNLPMGLRYIASKNTTFIPPNLTNCACVATPGWISDPAGTGTTFTNSSYPVPLEGVETDQTVRNWCPWPLLAFPPLKPGDGIYPYPDDKIVRPDFSPCKSACAATGSPQDCCVGSYHNPNACRPSLYSQVVKVMCPDAYSYAFDDLESTFAIPRGGGWEVVLCPSGRSTNILRQLGRELTELTGSGKLSRSTYKRLMNVTYIEADKDAASGVQPGLFLVATTLVAMAWVAL